MVWEMISDIQHTILHQLLRSMASSACLQSLAGYLGRGGRIGWCWAGKEGFGICFSVFLSAIAGVGFIGGGTGHWAMCPPKFEIFLIS